MTDSTPLPDPQSAADGTIATVTDVEMTSNVPVEDGQNEVPDPQANIATASPSVTTPFSSAQMDGPSDPPPTMNGHSSRSYLPNSTPSSLPPQQHQQQQPFAQPFPPGAYTYQPQPLASNASPGSAAQPYPRQSHTTPQPQAAATPTIGVQPGIPPGAIIPPANTHGSPTRVYINSKVTPMLLEGMKRLALEEPEKPLKWLGEWLCKKSEEVEGC